jgi:aminopeptidase N
MTKRIGVLVALCNKVNKFEVAKQIYNDFYEEYKDYSNVLNKWFSLKSSCNDDNILDVIRSLMQLDTFSFQNPNKVRATIGAFAGNALQFHKLDGSGYKFLEDMIIKMDGINPSISSSLAKIFSKIKHHKKVRQQLIYKSIDNILSQKISKGLFEILSKCPRYFNHLPAGEI